MDLEAKTDKFLKDLGEVLDEPRTNLRPEYSLTGDKWDSLVVLSAIALIDEHFAITVEGRDLKDVNSIGTLLNLINKKKGH